MTEAAGEKEVEEYKNLWGARIQWPCDLPDDMIEDVITTAQEALEHVRGQEENQKAILGGSLQNDVDLCAVSKYIKLKLEELKHGSWHIVAGKNFGTLVVHESSRFIYFYIGTIAFLMYKCA